MFKKSVLGTLVLLALFGFAACKDKTEKSSVSEDPASVTKDSQSNTKISLNDVLGLWTRQITEDTAGLFKFNQTGTFMFRITGYGKGHANFDGNIIVSGDKITFSSKRCDQPGEYQITLEDKELTLKALKDNCEPRKTDFPGTWTATESVN